MPDLIYYIILGVVAIVVFFWIILSRLWFPAKIILGIGWVALVYAVYSWLPQFLGTQ